MNAVNRECRECRKCLNVSNVERATGPSQCVPRRVFTSNDIHGLCAIHDIHGLHGIHDIHDIHGFYGIHAHSLSLNQLIISRVQIQIRRRSAM